MIMSRWKLDMTKHSMLLLYPYFQSRVYITIFGKASRSLNNRSVPGFDASVAKCRIEGCNPLPETRTRFYSQQPA